MMFCIWEDVVLGSPEQQKKSFRMTFEAYVELTRKLMSLLDLGTHRACLNTEAEEERAALTHLGMLCFVLVTLWKCSDKRTH